jgi:DNA-binding NarL/FixJ family response regulator
MSATPDTPIGLMLVDDHAVVRAGLRSYLDQVAGLAVVAEAANGSDALERLAELAADGRLPDVILMDLVMPGIDGIQTSIRITRRHPTAKILIMTSFGERERVRGSLDAGVSGYLLKDADSDEIVSAVRAAVRGELYLDAAVTRGLTDPVQPVSPSLGLLTSREREVLALIASGQSNRQIANHLGITERTARTHVANLFGKLKVVSRTQAALLAVREGLATGTHDPAAPD